MENNNEKIKKSAYSCREILREYAFFDSFSPFAHTNCKKEAYYEGITRNQ